MWDRSADVSCDSLGGALAVCLHLLDIHLGDTFLDSLLLASIHCQLQVENYGYDDDNDDDDSNDGDSYDYGSNDDDSNDDDWSPNGYGYVEGLAEARRLPRWLRKFYQERFDR
jgi:hypothetical protein